MKARHIYYQLLLLLMFASSCKKKQEQVQIQTDPADCNINAVLSQNGTKVTIANGVWGTVSVLSGNCMPIVGPHVNTCFRCPIKREVRIYDYTTIYDTKSGIGMSTYDSFSTRLVKTVTTDSDGFYQASLPDGKYTIVFVEDGKLYVSGFDGVGGIQPFMVQQNKFNADMTLFHAAF